jgi:hypothetical protein
VASLVNSAVFVASSGGIGAFNVSAAATGYRTPNAAGAQDGSTYRYRAQSADLSEWEEGSAVASSSASSFTRVVSASSAGGTTTVNFTNPPTVALTIRAEDILQFNDAMSLTDAQKAQGRDNLGIAKKNYIVNPAMMISQENGSTAGTVTGYYPADQFFVVFGNTSAAYSAARVASTTPGGSPNRIRLTVTTADTSIASNEFCAIGQYIEGYRVADLKLGLSDAKTVVLSFGCKGPAGTYGVGIQNSAQNRAYVAQFTIAAGEANTDVIKSVVIPLDQTGTWLTDNGVGLRVFWALVAGSSYQGTASAWNAASVFASASQFNFAGTNGNVFELFDVGLYEGTSAPAFRIPDYASELLACQRYYCKSFPLATNPAQNTGTTGALVGVTASTSAGSASIRQYWPVRMRTTPTVVTYNTSAANANWWDSNGSASRTVFIGEQSENSARIVVNATTSASSQHFIHWTANARM